MIKDLKNKYNVVFYNLGPFNDPQNNYTPLNGSVGVTFGNGIAPNIPELTICTKLVEGDSITKLHEFERPFPYSNGAFFEFPISRDVDSKANEILMLLWNIHHNDIVNFNKDLEKIQDINISIENYKERGKLFFEHSRELIKDIENIIIIDQNRFYNTASLIKKRYSNKNLISLNGIPFPKLSTIKSILESDVNYAFKELLHEYIQSWVVYDEVFFYSPTYKKRLESLIEEYVESEISTNINVMPKCINRNDIPSVQKNKTDEYIRIKEELEKIEFAGKTVLVTLGNRTDPIKNISGLLEIVKHLDHDTLSKIVVVIQARPYRLHNKSQRDELMKIEKMVLDLNKHKKIVYTFFEHIQRSTIYRIGKYIDKRASIYFACNMGYEAMALGLQDTYISAVEGLKGLIVSKDIVLGEILLDLGLSKFVLNNLEDPEKNAHKLSKIIKTSTEEIISTQKIIDSVLEEYNIEKWKLSIIKKFRDLDY